MVLFNYSTRELTAKIVYYGPGLCGKTTNLQFVHENLPGNVKGKMLSLATKTDRTLFFDFLPIDLGEIRGMKTRVQLYTVPGQVFYNETRRLVLKGADGVVFVADSQAAMMEANVASLRNLEENLLAHGMKLDEMPIVLQFNKRDLTALSSIEELNAGLNRFKAPYYESVATKGIGVQETLKAITKLVLLHLTRKYDSRGQAVSRPDAAKAPAAVPPPSPAAMPQTAVPVPTPAPTPGPVVAAADSERLSQIQDAEVTELLSEVEESPRQAHHGATQAGLESEEEFELDEEMAAEAEPEPETRGRAMPSPVPASSLVATPGPPEVPQVAGGDGATAPLDIVPPRPVPGADLTLTEVPPDHALFQNDDLEVAILKPSEQKEILVPLQIEVEGRILRYRLSLRLSLDSVRHD